MGNQRHDHVRPVAFPVLLEQAYLLDFHPAVHRLHHVVDREQRNGHRRQRLHLHARAPLRLRHSPHPDPRKCCVGRRLHGDLVEVQRVTERDQLRRALRRERAGHLTHSQDVALGDRSLRYLPERVGRHADRPFGHRRA